MICRKQFKYQSKLYSFANGLHFEVLDVTSTGLETKNETAASTWATVWRTATVKCRSPIPLSCKGYQYPSVAQVTKTPQLHRSPIPLSCTGHQTPQLHRSPIPLSCTGHQYPSVAQVTKTPQLHRSPKPLSCTGHQNPSVAQVTNTPQLHRSPNPSVAQALSCTGHQNPSVAQVTQTPKEINPRNDDLTVLLIVVVAICFIACITISVPNAISEPFI